MAAKRKITLVYGTEEPAIKLAPRTEDQKDVKKKRTYINVDFAKPYDEVFFEQGLASGKKDVGDIRDVSKTKVMKTIRKIEGREVGPKIEGETLVFKEINKGDNWKILDILGNELQVGVFANADFPQKGLIEHREIAAPGVNFINNRVTVTMLDGIQEDKGDLEAFEKALAEFKKTSSYASIKQTDVCMSKIRVDVDLSKKTLDSTVGTSEVLGYWGNRCFLMRKGDIIDCSSTSSQIDLRSGDVIFVASNNVLHRLIQENLGANSKSATQEYRDALIMSDIKTLLSGVINKDGSLAQKELFIKLSDMYFESRVMGQKGLVASAYVAYQIP